MCFKDRLALHQFHREVSQIFIKPLYIGHSIKSRHYITSKKELFIKRLSEFNANPLVHTNLKNLADNSTGASNHSTTCCTNLDFIADSQSTGLIDNVREAAHGYGRSFTSHRVVAQNSISSTGSSSNRQNATSTNSNKTTALFYQGIIGNKREVAEIVNSVDIIRHVLYLLQII